MNHIVLYTDGGSRGNPGPAALGVYIETLGKEYAQTLGTTTNNEAEYQAIVFGLKKLRQLLGKEKSKRTTLEVKSDSQLIVSQLNGVFKIKEMSLGKYFIEIWNLKQEFAGVIFTHIPREKNAIADRVLNEALDQEERKKLF